MLLNDSVIVMGIPGSGKSTFCQNLQRANPAYKYLAEPLNEKIVKALEVFYKSPEGATLPTQLEFIDAWAEVIDRARTGQIMQFGILTFLDFLHNASGSRLKNIIIDASPFSVLYHSEAARSLGWLNDEEYLSFKSYYEIMKSHWEPYLPETIIYNKVEVSVALERISKRARPFEKNVSRGYLTLLKEYLEDFLKSQSNVIIVENPERLRDTTECQFCESKGFVVKEKYSRGKIEPSAVFDCGFCKQSKQ